jgi:catechol 2,3-dioxygenase-like lactoylglutathione lyase family enzyme
MNLEHLGLNHRDPVAAAQWYCQNLGMTVARKFDAPGHGHFLADARGKMMLEFYFDASVPVPDYAAMDAFAFHVAFQVNDVAANRARLLTTGATPEGDIKTNADGDQLTIVRDPWGLALQLVKRAQPMLEPGPIPPVETVEKAKPT